MYRLVWKSWGKILSLNLLLPISFLAFPMNMKVAASVQGYLMLLLLLFLHSSCYTCAQLTPKPAWPLSNECDTLWCVKIRIFLIFLALYQRT